MDIIAHLLIIKQLNKYTASIRCQGVNHFCGRYENEKDAARARNAKAIELHADLASLNNISDDEE
jgi:hypothetical protein